MIDTGVKTYSNREALDKLAELAAKVAKSSRIVEVGVFRGGSLRVIAEAAKCQVYGVDTWGLEGAYVSGSENPAKYGDSNRVEAERHCAGLPNVTLVKGFSADIAALYTQPKIGLLYIDAEHTREGVLSDFAAWSPHLRKNATVAFDDYTTKPEHASLRAGIDELVEAGRIELVGVYGGRLAVARLVG